MDYKKIEEQQEENLPSEYEEKEQELQESYEEYLKRQGYIQDQKSDDERLEKMKTDALSLYEEGLNNSSIPFGQRRQIADKVLEITGILKTKKDDNSGNTFVFSDKFADKVLNTMEKMKNSLTEDNNNDPEKRAEEREEIRDTRDVTPDSTGS